MLVEILAGCIGAGALQPRSRRRCTGGESGDEGVAGGDAWVNEGSKMSAVGYSVCNRCDPSTATNWRAAREQIFGFEVGKKHVCDRPKNTCKLDIDDASPERK